MALCISAFTPMCLYIMKISKLGDISIDATFLLETSDTIYLRVSM